MTDDPVVKIEFNPSKTIDILSSYSLSIDTGLMSIGDGDTITQGLLDHYNYPIFDYLYFLRIFYDKIEKLLDQYFNYFEESKTSFFIKEIVREVESIFLKVFETVDDIDRELDPKKTYSSEVLSEICTVVYEIVNPQRNYLIKGNITNKESFVSSTQSRMNQFLERIRTSIRRRLDRR